MDSTDAVSTNSVSLKSFFPPHSISEAFFAMDHLHARFISAFDGAFSLKITKSDG